MLPPPGRRGEYRRGGVRRSPGWDTERPVIDDLDLILERGSTTTIIGAGPDESTILGLIAGLYQVKVGVVGRGSVGLRPGPQHVAGVGVVASAPFAHPDLRPGHREHLRIDAFTFEFGDSGT